MKKNYILALIAVTMWGTMGPVVKLVLAKIPNLQALSVSGLFAFLFLFLTNLLSGTLKTMKQYRIKDYMRMVGLGFIGMFLYSALYYYGIAQLTVQEACILNYLWPIMLVLFSCIILHEKMNVKKLIAIGMSFLGIIVLTSGNTSGGNGNTVLGVLSCIAAAACYGLFSVLNKKENMEQNISMMVIWPTVAICSFFVGMPTENWVPIHGIQWLGLAWLGVGTNAIAYLFWAMALKGAKEAAGLANLAYLAPVISILLSAVFLKEAIRVNVIIALFLIVGGILLQNIRLPHADKGNCR